MTKVVDRRWYERNKHIFPATLWKEYEAGADFTEKISKMRRDAEGNAFFFS
jgi:protein FAM50